MAGDLIARFRTQVGTVIVFSIQTARHWRTIFFSRMKLVLVILMISMLTQESETQVLYELYKQFLPPSHEPALAPMIDDNLQSMAAIHPDLIYFFVQGLDTSARGGWTLAEALQQKRPYRKRRSTWAMLQSSRLADFNLDPELLRQGRLFFDRLIDSSDHTATTDIISDGIDFNRLNFLSLLGLTRDRSLQFVPSTNYESLRIEHEREWHQYYRNLVDRLGDPSMIPTLTNDSLVSILNQWYYFDSPLLSDAEKVDPCRIIEQYLTRKFTFEKPSMIPTDQKMISVLFALNRTFLFSTTLTDNPIKEVMIEEPLRFQQPGLSFGYKFYLKPVKASFSYLNFEVNLASTPGTVAYTMDLDQSKVRTFQSDFQISYVSERIFDLGSTVSVQSALLFFLSGSTPLFYPHPSTAFEIGLFLGVNRIGYSLHYVYEYRQSVTTQYGDGTQEVQVLSQGTRQATLENQSMIRFTARPLVGFATDHFSPVLVRIFTSYDAHALQVSYPL